MRTARARVRMIPAGHHCSWQLFVAMRRCFPPLVRATQKKRSDIVDMLLAAGCDVNLRGRGRLTALHAASNNGSRAIVVNLLKKGANANLCDIMGCNALHRAATSGFDEILKILLKADADPNRRDTMYLLSPLHSAARRGDHKCAQSLLLAKADVSVRDVMLATPLHHASTDGYTEVIELLLSARADVRAQDRHGRTALDLASRNGHAEAVTLLIEAGGDPNSLDEEGKNSLFGVSSLQVIKVLLDRGASAKVIDNDGLSILQRAGFNGYNVGVICALFKGGADPTLKKCGLTAADFARAQGHETAAKMLDLLVAKHQASLASHTPAVHVTECEGKQEET